jgi:hypothetical protein
MIFLIIKITSSDCFFSVKFNMSKECEVNFLKNSYSLFAVSKKSSIFATKFNKKLMNRFFAYFYFYFYFNR